MSGEKSADWKHLGHGKVVAEDIQRFTIATEGEIFERGDFVKVVDSEGNTRRFNVERVQELKYRKKRKERK